MSKPLESVRNRTLLLLVLVVLTLAACGGDEEGPTVVTTDSIETHPSSTPASPTEEATLQPTDSDPTVAAPTPSPPSTPGESPTEEALEMLFASPEYGVHAFLWWQPDIAQRDLNLVEEMEFGWVKQSFAWRDIESIEKGKYDWWHPDQIVDAADEIGLNLLVRIDRQPFWSQGPDADLKNNTPPADLNDFGDFCGTLAERYKGRIDAYQIWNEPNLSREWGDQPPDPAAYTELLKVCYQAIKEVDPDAIVISAGLAPTGTGLPVALPDTSWDLTHPATKLPRKHHQTKQRAIQSLGVGGGSPLDTSKICVRS